MNTLQFGFVVLIFLSTTLTVSQGAALPGDDVIDGEYVVLMRENSPVSSLGDLLDDMTVLGEQSMATRSYLHLKTGDEGVKALQEHPSVEVVEPNRMVNFVSPVETGEGEQTSDTGTSTIDLVRS